VIFFLYAWSVRKDKSKTIDALKKSGRFVLRSLPIFFMAMLLIGFFVIAFLPTEDIILSLFGELDTGILWGTFYGFLLPGPRYAIYPLAEIILVAGGNIGAVMALIASQQLISMPDGAIVEVKYFGWRYFLVSMTVATITTILAGYLAFVVDFFFLLYP
jgi:uncharacterized membrane protein YraQ (UPF0718 family)